jgi:deferrochelatase/peroxidase EfeB
MTPLDSHIRLANPRRDETEENIILRRPFNYSNGVTKSGQLDQGLLFICYQADLEKGFIAVQRRLDGEPLEEYIKPVGGGYFFALPGARDASDYLGSQLIAAARSAATGSL